MAKLTRLVETCSTYYPQQIPYLFANKEQIYRSATFPLLSDLLEAL